MVGDATDTRFQRRSLPFQIPAPCSPLIARSNFRKGDMTMTNDRKAMTKDEIKKNGWRSARTLDSILIQKLPRSTGYMHRLSTPTASIQNCQRNTSTLGGNISPVLPEAMCGSGLATCPKRPETPYGKDTGQSWRFRRDWKDCSERGASGRLGSFQKQNELRGDARPRRLNVLGPNGHNLSPWGV
jgi:hypothetical protein